MKSLVLKLYMTFVRMTRLLGWLPPLIARVSVGAVFAETGWGKLHNIDNFASYLEKLHVPFAHAQAPFVATVEAVCGSLLVIGLMTRVVSIPLIIIMVVAVMTAKSAEINSATDLFAVFEYLFAVLLVWLAIDGPGPVSVDRIVGIESTT